MRPVGGVALAYLYAVFLFASMPALMGDYLFYRSDFFSLAVVTLSGAVILLPLTTFVAALISFLPRRAGALVGRWSALFAAIGIVNLFLTILCLYLIGLIDWSQLHRIIRHPLVVVVATLIPAAALVLLHRDRDGLIARVGHVGIVALVCAPLLAAWSALSASDRPNSETTGRQLVLIVLDAWPSQHLHAYNAQAPRSALDSMLQQARVFHGVYTSAAWTGGYFGALYNGDTGVVAGKSYTFRKGMSLGAALQSRGVGVRFMNFHRNGIPDASAARRHDHTGLRSYFLTESYAWLPAMLGLDYHLVLSGGAISQNFRRAVPLALFNRLNPVPLEQRRNALTEVLIPELRRMRRRRRQGFTLFHTVWSGIGKDRGGPEIAFPRAQVTGKPVRNLSEKIRANEYRYGPEAEPQAAYYRELEAKKTQLAATLVGEFISALRADPALHDVTTVLTADHGSMYAKGRYWYGFHSHREVVQVPFVVFGPGSRGVDHALFATPSITRAIKGYFEGALARTAFELKGEPPDVAYSLTLRSNIHNEWVLVATLQERTYWLNLHPDGTGKTREINYTGYEGSIVSEAVGPPAFLSPGMAEVLASFGIDPSAVHPAFR